MSCSDVANTGLPVIMLVTVAGVCVLAGLTLVILARAPRGRLAIVAILLLLAGSLVTSAIASPFSAGATTPGCQPTAPPALTITQTSTLTGLAPGVAPLAIVGLVVNTGAGRVLVNRVTVHIVSVTPASGTPAGRCDASDYVLLDAVMPVGRSLAAGASVRFAGARIGFRNKAVNQDACQRAQVDLGYVSS